MCLLHTMPDSSFSPFASVPLDPAVLDRWLAGEHTRHDAELVQQAIAADPRLGTLLELVRERPPVAQRTALRDAGVLSVDPAWQLVARRIGLTDAAAADLAMADPAMADPSETRRKRTTPTAPLHRWSASRRAWRSSRMLAAVATACLATAAVVGLAVRGPLRSILVSRSAPMVYATHLGQRSSFVLPDGSLVSLNVASRLEVPADFARGNHTVRLSGEAIFRVRHDASAPFVVQTARTSARVLGTSFLVRQYDTDSAATVAVRDGRVGVRSVVLSANQQVAVGARGVGPVQSASASAFTFATGVLTFDGVTLAQAIPDLDRWYDVDLRLGDPALARLTPAGGFTAGSPADLSALLTMMFPVRVERHGRVLTLYSK